jgi:hypothetical protein
MFALKRQFAGWAFEVMDMGGSGGNFAGTCTTKGFGSILRQAPHYSVGRRLIVSSARDAARAREVAHAGGRLVSKDFTACP